MTGKQGAGAGSEFVTVAQAGMVRGPGAGSVVRDKFRSVTSLPTFIKTPVNLASFPGDSRHREAVREANISFKHKY